MLVDPSDSWPTGLVPTQQTSGKLNKKLAKQVLHLDQLNSTDKLAANSSLHDQRLDFRKRKTDETAWENALFNNGVY